MRVLDKQEKTREKAEALFRFTGLQPKRSSWAIPSVLVRLKSGPYQHHLAPAVDVTVDFVWVTRRDLDDQEFQELDRWFGKQQNRNRRVKRIDMRFVIDQEFFDKSSRCCGFYHYTGKLVRHGSDGNPIIWVNVAQYGVTLWGKDAKLVAPHVSDQRLNDALLLEPDYLKEDLVANVGEV
jgi:hypothetical protein